jgi:formylglycine-generating enzyme required for sulfatase activity
MKLAALKSTSTANTARLLFLAALALATVIVPGAIPAPALAATPQVTNVVAVQRSGTKLVDVTYDVYDAGGHAMTVALYISPDGGVSFPIHCLTVSGDVGAGVLSGTGRHIVWDAGADYPGHVGETYAPKVTADDGQGVAGMVWIPAGNVRLGQVGIAEPVNNFYVQGFYIDIYEVSNAKYKAFIDAGGYTNSAYWNSVGWAWRVANSITLPLNWNSNTYHGGGIAGNDQFPVNGVSWWEADAYCRWAGVRLPTEAEWEKAAKGGCETHGDPGTCDASDTPTYPWGEGISGPQANYFVSGDPYENNGWTTPVGYYDGSNHGGYQTINSPSPYGLYDVAGNVWEWCSTRYAEYPYNPSDGRENPPVSYSECCRVLRGGSYNDDTDDRKLRCAHRYYGIPTYRGYAVGFRCVRTGS